MAGAREWIHHGGWTKRWHLRTTPSNAGQIRPTTAACGQTFPSSQVFAVWAGDAPPPGERCPGCAEADVLLRMVDERDA